MTLTPFSPLSRIDALIVAIAESGRAATEAELREIAAYVAAKGFDPLSANTVDRRGAGVQWEGHVYQRGEVCTNELRHFLVHVLAQGEWPAGTSLAQYVQALRDAVCDPESGIHLSYSGDRWQLSFFALTRAARGPRGGTYILVGYAPTYGWWSTGFQIESPATYLATKTNWRDTQWLRHPK